MGMLASWIQNHRKISVVLDLAVKSVTLEIAVIQMGHFNYILEVIFQGPALSPLIYPFK